MPSSNNPIKQFFFMGLAAVIGIGFASLLSQGVSNYTNLVSNLSDKVISNQAVVVETIPTPLLMPAAVLPELPKEVTLNFVGDIMLDRGIKNSIENNFGGDYSKLFENVPSLSQADISFGNLEGPVSTGGKKSGSVYSFRFSPDSLAAVAGAGFDVLNIANNHIGDWGAVALADTLDNIISDGLQYTGGGWDKKEAEAPVIIEKNGISVGFLGFSDVGPDWMEAKKNGTHGILLASDPDFDQIIQNAANQVDILAVSFHWGEEYKKHNDRQEKLARKAIDSGAKLVIGHHPHVIQDTEEYHGGLIAYSLGNFIFDQKFSKETMEGLLLEVTVSKYGIKNHSLKLIKLNDIFQPQAPVPYDPS